MKLRMIIAQRIKCSAMQRHSFPFLLLLLLLNVYTETVYNYNQSQAMKLKGVTFKMTKSISFLTTHNNNKNNLYLYQAILIEI